MPWMLFSSLSYLILHIFNMVTFFDRFILSTPPFLKIYQFFLSMSCVAFIRYLFFLIAYIHFILKYEEYTLSFPSVLFLIDYQICLLFSAFLSSIDLVLASFCSLCFLDWGKFCLNQWCVHEWEAGWAKCGLEKPEASTWGMLPHNTFILSQSHCLSGYLCLLRFWYCPLALHGTWLSPLSHPLSGFAVSFLLFKGLWLVGSENS